MREQNSPYGKKHEILNFHLIYSHEVSIPVIVYVCITFWVVSIFMSSHLYTSYILKVRMSHKQNITVVGVISVDKRQKVALGQIKGIENRVNVFENFIYETLVNF